MKIPLTPLRFLRYATEQFPNKIGVVCGQDRFTYSHFAERAGRLAGALIMGGAKHGDRIAFLSTNCHRLLEAYYGVLEAGCVLVPLNIRLSAQDIAFALNDVQARYLFVDPPFLPIAEFIRSTVTSVEKFYLLNGKQQLDWVAPQTYDELLAAAPHFQCDFTQIEEDSLAEIFYTSGSSDRPKGVMLTHRNIYLHALSVIAAAQTSASTIGEMCCKTVLLHTIPLFHANGWGTAHSITVVGGTHVMVQQFNPTEVFRLIEQEHVTTCCMVPTMITALLNSATRPEYDLSSLRILIVGGAASSATLVKDVEEKLGCTCITGYGLTETCPTLAKSQVKEDLSIDGVQRYVRHAMAGFAIPGVEIRVIGAEGKDVPHYGISTGEIVVRGDVVMEGYWRQPQATADTIKDGWFHTGDMAVLDQHNYIQIVDRKKEIIVSGGENVSSLEVEKVLCSHPDVYEAPVIPVAHEKWGEVPKAVLVLKAGSRATEDDILLFCRARLSHYKCPRTVEFVESLPKTGSGKVLKRELRQKYAVHLKTTVS